MRGVAATRTPPKRRLETVHLTPEAAAKLLEHNTVNRPLSQPHVDRLALAERLVDTLEDPAGVATTDPFFKLRSFFTQDHHRSKDPIVVIALAIKAINAAYRGDKITMLSWKRQGKAIEEFPLMMVEGARTK